MDYLVTYTQLVVIGINGSYVSLESQYQSDGAIRKNKSLIREAIV